MRRLFWNNLGGMRLSSADSFTAENAIAYTGEANATTGVTNAGLAVMTADATVTNGSNYAIKIDASAAPTNDARLFFLLTDFGCSLGKRYRMTFDTRHLGAGGAWSLGVVATQTTRGAITLAATDTTYQSFAIDFLCDTAHDTFVAIENSDTNNGGVYIDNMVIREWV